MFTQILSTQFLQCSKQRDLYIGGKIYFIAESKSLLIFFTLKRKHV